MLSYPILAILSYPSYPILAIPFYPIISYAMLSYPILLSYYSIILLGRLPVQITLVKKTLKYYSYLCAKDENTIAKQAFLIANELDLENQ